MSGLREIIQWVESEDFPRPENTVNQEYERISGIFEGDHRSSLDHILAGDKKEFLDFLRSRLSRARDEPEADKEIITFEPPITAFERSIENILQGARNLLRRIFG